MSKLDLHLLNLQKLRHDDGAARMHEMAAADYEPVFFAKESPDPSDDNPQVSLIVRFDGDLRELEKAGMEIDTVAGNIATGSISVDRLDALEKAHSLQRAEAALPLKATLNDSVAEIKADQVHSGPPGLRGTGVVIGIVDSGVDFTHGSFQKATGGTRIKRLWDQTLTRVAGEASPSAFSYGVEYDDAAIDAGLGTPNPFNSVRVVADAHGTHVAGIAAGDGSPPGNGEPADTFVGVAPEATLVCVTTDFMTSGVIDGVNYVFQVAQSLGVPAVVNLSLGSSFGPHDGTSNFEQGLTNLINGNGKVVVAAAGNEAADNAHASGTVGAGTTTNLTINVPNNRRARVVLDLWYDGASTFGVRLTDPAGNTTGNVGVGGIFNGALGAANVALQHVNNDPNNGDKRVVLIINPPVGGNVPIGAWQLQIVGNVVSDGTFDTWVVNPAGQPLVSFPAATATAVGTVSPPSTSNRVISVGSYITAGAGVGSISAFSNLGPTRDGRRAPNITAPGQRITSAAVLSSGAVYRGLSGTSMACPHITGVVALMFEQDRDRDWEAIRDCLQSTARSDEFTGTTPNNTWGPGKVDAPAAVRCGVSAPVISRVTPCGVVSRLTPCFSRSTIACVVSRTTPCTLSRITPCAMPSRIIPCMSRTLPCLTTSIACRLPVTRSPIACGAPSRVDACPTRGVCVPTSRAGCRTPFPERPFERATAAEKAGPGGRDSDSGREQEGYAAGFEDGYAYAYAEAYGTYDVAQGESFGDATQFGCEHCAYGQKASCDRCGFHDPAWFDPNEFG